MNRVLRVTRQHDGMRIDRFLTKELNCAPAFVQKQLRKGRVRGVALDESATPASSSASTAVTSIRVGSRRVVAGEELHVDASWFRQSTSDVVESSTLSSPLTRSEIDFVRSLVIYSDRHMVALNKPAGLATQSGHRVDERLYVDRLLDGLALDGATERPKLIHRLDKDTSGVLLVARCSASARILSRAMQPLPSSNDATNDDIIVADDEPNKIQKTYL